MKSKAIKFILGLFCIWAFIFVLAPALSKIKAYEKIRTQIEKEDIDSGALFYTESPEAGQAEFYLKKHKKEILSKK